MVDHSNKATEFSHPARGDALPRRPIEIGQMGFRQGVSMVLCIALFFTFWQSASAIPTLFQCDYNENGVCEASDYVLWRKAPSLYHGDPLGYVTWREGFGDVSAGAGTAHSVLDAIPSITPGPPLTGLTASGSMNVPEPCWLTMLSLFLCLPLFGRRRP